MSYTRYRGGLGVSKHNTAGIGGAAPLLTPDPKFRIMTPGNPNLQ